MSTGVRLFISATAGLVALALIAPASAQDADCERYELRGLSIGMIYRDVWETMGGKGDKRRTEIGPQGSISTATYHVKPASVVVHYDRVISRKSPARVILLETRAGATLEDLIERLGLPTEGTEQLAAPAPREPVLWTDEVCGVTVEVFADSTGWWQPARTTMTVRVQASRGAGVVQSGPTDAMADTDNEASVEPAGAEQPATDVARRDPSPLPETASTSEQAPTRTAAPDESETDPLFAGIGGVTFPERIEESYVEPDFPPVALKARTDGKVLLQAVIRKDGTVGELIVLSCSRPGVGFEEAAVEAVTKWRYRPATFEGRPVDAYASVTVEFR